MTTADTNRQDQVRRQVSEAYARAVTERAGCCGGGAPRGVSASAGYAPADLASVPGDAVESAMGCGNPLAFGEVREGDVVVDLGSGAGIDLVLAARRVGPTGRVIGVDMTDAMIDRARANAAAAGLGNVEVRKGIIEALPVETASADWVISNCVINLSPDKPRVFSEIARVLKPGGRMLVSDIVARDLPAWVRELEVAYAACVAGAISEEEYLAGLRAAGIAAEVRSRHVYDADQIAGLVESELPDAKRALSCCGASVDAALAAAAREVAGKVWSAQFVGTRAA